jgi:hypothetical protein
MTANEKALPKRPYNPPELRSYGDLALMTKANTMQGNNDGGKASNKTI